MLVPGVDDMIVVGAGEVEVSKVDGKDGKVDGEDDTVDGSKVVPDNWVELTVDDTDEVVVGFRDIWQTNLLISEQSLSHQPHSLEPSLSAGNATAHAPWDGKPHVSL